MIFGDGDIAATARTRVTTQTLQPLYNIGNQSPVELMEYIAILERKLNKKAEKNLLPMQLGDAPDNWADVEALVRDVGYRPSTSVEVGVGHFVDWYLGYYGRENLQ